MMQSVRKCAGTLIAFLSSDGHGFDDDGRTFDGDGVMRNWWTEKDAAEYKKQTSALVDQYNQFQVFQDSG